MSAVVGGIDAAAASGTAVVEHGDAAAASTASQFDSYIYDALPDQHFRLIRVVQHNAGLISCEIKTFSRLQNPAYAALSYAWGEPPDTHCISIDGKRKAIRENLWHFLHDTGTQDEWLWIDAICINQDDLEERSQQVQMMTSTFRLAERTYIWLGPFTAGSDVAMQLISRTTMPSNRKAFKAHTFGSLIHRAYWTRLWVLQELMLSGRKVLCCGSETAPFEAFRYLLTNDAGHQKNNSGLDESTALADPARSMLLLTRLDAQHNLLGLMAMTKHLNCAELHDRAFALLGVRPLGSETIITDYDMPIPYLLNSILLRSHQNVNKPRDVDEVVEQCQSLSMMFGQEDIIFLFDASDRYPPAYELPADVELEKGTGCESIAWALYYGHTSVLEILLEQSKDEAHVWLWQAAAQGNERTTKVLLSCGARLIANSDLRSAAALMKRISMLKDPAIFRIFKKYDLMSVEQDDIGQIVTAGLHGAAVGGNIGRLRFWLTRLAEVMPDREHCPRLEALSAAQESGDRRAMETILDYRTQHESKPELERAALVMAAKRGYLQLGEVLYSRGAHRLRHALLPSWSFLYEAIKAGQTTFIKWALDKGQDVNETISDGYSFESPVLLAAQYSKHDVVDLLLARGANVEADRDAFVIYSARSGNMKILKMTVTGRAMVDRQSFCYQPWDDREKVYPYSCLYCSALAVACLHDRQEVIHFLLQNGADVNKLCKVRWGMDWRYCTPLYLAVATGSLTTTELLLQAGASPRITAAYGDNKSLGIRSDGDSLARPTVPIYEQHAIWIAARDGRTDLVKLLYQQWPSLPSAVNHQRRGRPKSRKVLHRIGILYIAAAYGRHDTVKLLLQWGAGNDPESLLFCEHDASKSNRKKQAWSALYVAAARGDHAMVKLLLDAGIAVAGAEVICLGKRKGRAHALRAAINNGDTEMIELLQSYGAVDTSANVHLFEDFDNDEGFWKAPLYIERSYVPRWSSKASPEDYSGTSSKEDLSSKEQD